MARLMSVAYTEPQVRDRSKSVTRRLGWWEDKNGRRLVAPGDHLTLCRKVMGRKKGEPLVRIVDVEVTDVRRERLAALLDPMLYPEPSYATNEMIAEGFPGMAAALFVARYFVQAQRVDPWTTTITRIQWKYLPNPTEGTQP